MLRKTLLILILTATSFAASKVECGKISSKYVAPSVGYCALLPPSFAANKTKTFPILYLLHGLGDNEQTLINSGIWNMVEQNMPKRYQDALARNPTGRMATPQEIANAAVFLASPASSFTTGSNLVVDGAISNRVNF